MVVGYSFNPVNQVVFFSPSICIDQLILSPILSGSPDISSVLTTSSKSQQQVTHVPNNSEKGSFIDKKSLYLAIDDLLSCFFKLTKLSIILNWALLGTSFFPYL